MKQTLDGARWVVIAVAVLTALGFSLRLARYQQTVFGDELSTLYGVDGRSFSEALSYVSSDAEISPPLFFILAWLTTKVGAAPELVRLPSLIAGTVSIPLVYMVGARAINRLAGLLAAGVMALSPFMIFYSADGRGYAVAIAFLLGSTLAMLQGAETGKRGWWVAYGAFSLLAMYTHYTVAFPLVAQLLWLLWAYPPARRPALIATAGAAVLYLPWIPSLAADFESPTTDILYAVQGSGLGTKMRGIASWAIGYPYSTLSEFPGWAGLLGAVGLAAAATAAILRHFRDQASALPDSSDSSCVSAGMVLLLALAVANVGIAFLFLILTGNDLLSARNFVTASAGFALLASAIIVSAGRFWGSACGILITAALLLGAAKTLETGNQLPDFKSAAAYIDAVADTDSVIVDTMTTTAMTPVPLTSLDANLKEARPEYRIGLPIGEPPLLLRPPAPAPGQLRQAVRQARGRTLIVVAGNNSVVRQRDGATMIVLGPPNLETFTLPSGSRVAAKVRFPGFEPVEVVSIGLEPALKDR